VDIELFDRIDHPRRISRPTGHAGALQSIRPAFSVFQRPVRSGATPADLITLTTPAVKPSSTNTMSPQGDVDSKWSIPQPINAPTILRLSRISDNR
jgi:hypothetical protein